MKLDLDIQRSRLGHDNYPSYLHKLYHSALEEVNQWEEGRSPQGNTLHTTLHSACSWSYFIICFVSLSLDHPLS